MNKSLETLIELGVNLIIAVAVIAIMLTVLSSGRDSVNAIEQDERAAKVAEQQATFGGLNGQTVEYGRIIELVTCNAGDYDIYVDSTTDGGAILISKHLYGGAKTWSDALASNGYARNVNLSIGENNGSAYSSCERYLDAQVQTLLASDISSKFANGKWKVYLAVNDEFVGRATGTEPSESNTVTGLRFVRIQ